MKDAIKKLTDEQFCFIERELGYTKDEVLEMSEDDLYDKVYDEFCTIEEIETVEALDRPGEEISERGELASIIVTILGNSL